MSTSSLEKKRMYRTFRAALIVIPALCLSATIIAAHAQRGEEDDGVCNNQTLSSGNTPLTAKEGDCDNQPTYNMDGQLSNQKHQNTDGTSAASQTSSEALICCRGFYGENHGMIAREECEKKAGDVAPDNVCLPGEAARTDSQGTGSAGHQDGEIPEGTSITNPNI